MPELMLKRDWPSTFRRTVASGKKTQVLTFAPGEPVEVDARQIEALRPDIGVCLVPVERDAKGKIRTITDDVVPETEEAKTNVALAG